MSVGEEEVAQGMVGLYTHHGIQVEASAGAAVAALLRRGGELRGKTCVVVAAGGNVGYEEMQRAYALAGAGPTASMG